MERGIWKGGREMSVCEWAENEVRECRMTLAYISEVEFYSMHKITTLVLTINGERS
jgi:hypothetical protein